MITKRAARKLTEQFRSGLINAERAMQEIIADKAWEPLGYGSFTAWWDGENFGDITLATELRPHVIYTMLDEGQSVDAIAETVKGIGPELVKSVARQRRHGVPAGDVRVRRHDRGRPSAPYRIITEIG